MSLEELINYLVRLRLADNKKALCILELASNGEHPSKIYEECKATRDELRSYLNRVREKMGNGYKTFVIIKHVIPLLSDIKPVIVDGRCTLCGADMQVNCAIMSHLFHRHKDVVDYYVQWVIDKLRERVNGNKNS